MVRSFIPLSTNYGPLSEGTQGTQITGNPSEHDLATCYERACTFRGDGDLRAPPLAWITIWGGFWRILYGCYIEDRMREWGYVFWDAATLEEVLKRDRQSLGPLITLGFIHNDEYDATVQFYRRVERDEIP